MSGPIRGKKPTATGPISSGKFKPQGLGVALGRIRGPEGTIVSARLNPDLAEAVFADVAIDSEEGQAEIAKLLQTIQAQGQARKAGGKPKRQLGGENVDIMRLYGLTDLQTVQETAAYMKAIVHMAVFNAKEALKEGWSTSEEMRRQSANYFRENYAPLYAVSAKVLEIILGLAEQLIVKLPVTVAMLTGGSFGFTANFFRWVFTKVNDYGRGVSEYLLADDTAKKAAEAALGTTTEALKTGVAVAFIANQLGLLPVSAVLAAILWQIQASFGTGAGRAYVMASFYAWYQSQDNRAELDAAIKDYAVKAQAAIAAKGGEGAAAAQAALAEAAAKLGPLLAKGADAGKHVAAYSAALMAAGVDQARIAAIMAGDAGVNAGVSAFQAVSNAVRGARGRIGENRAPADPVAALQQGAPAAAVAAAQAPAAVAADPAAAAAIAQEAPFPPVVLAPRVAQGGRKQRGKKKTRRAPKRRITRRARKYLAAPVFAY